MRNYKRVFSLLLAVMLIVSSINMTVFAVGEEETQFCTETVGCTKADACAAETHEEDCPKYAAPSASNKNDEPAAPAAPAEPTEPAAPAAPAEPTEPAVRSEAYQTVVALFEALPDASVITEETTDEEKAAIAAQLEEAIAALEEELSDEDYQLFHEEQAELLLAVSDLMDALDGGKADYNNAAEVDGTPYATLAEAVAAAQPGKTVKLLKNVHLSSTLEISAEKNITLDLAGYAITVEESKIGRHYYAIDNYGTFVLKDSVGHGSITARGIENLGGGKMTIQGGEIIAQDTNGGAAIWNEANLTIEGGTFRTTHVGSSGDKYGPGCLNNIGTALITGGKFESVNKRTYAIISTGEIEITPAEGKTVEVAGAHGGLGVDSGTAVVNGGSFSSTEYYGLYVSNDGVGTDPKQAAVTVNGGTFTGLAYSVWIGSDYNNPVNSTIEINGGYFNKPLNAQECTREGAIAIKGGNFTADPAAYVDTTKYHVKNTAGAEYPYSVELRDETNSVARIGGTFYETLADALKAAQPGDTVKLLRNVTLEDTITITKSVVLDLNTFTIDMIADGGRMFKDDGTVDFEVKNGNLKNTDDKVFYWSNGGTLTLTGVTANAGEARVVQMDGDADTLIIGQGTSIYGEDNVIYLNGKGEQTVKIYGEVSVGSDGLGAICVSGRAGGTPTIEVYDGATVSSVGGAAIQFGTSIKLKVVGGTLQGGDNAVEAYDDDDYENDVDITVVDGSFVSGGNIKGCIDIADLPKFISGGYFTNDPSKYVAEGKIAAYYENDSVYPYHVETLGASNATAQINNQFYESVAKAVEAAQPGDTVKLLKDSTTSTVVISKNLTLDLNGKQLKQGLVTQNVIELNGPDNTLTVIDTLGGGVILAKQSKSNSIAVRVNAGTFNLESGSLKGAYGIYAAGENPTVVNINGGYCEGVYTLSYAGTGIYVGKQTTLNMTDGEVFGKIYGISGNGSAGNGGTTINISGGTVAANEGANEQGCAVFHPQAGMLNVYGNAVIRGSVGIQMCSGTLNVSGNASVTATGKYYTSKYAQGRVPDAAAISVINRGYPGGEPTVNITGGMFDASGADGNKTVYAHSWIGTEPTNTGAAPEWADAVNNISISGGVFSVRPDSRYVVEGKAALMNDDPATKAEYAFKIGVPPTGVTVIEVTQGAPEVSTGAGITSDKVTAAGEAAKAITGTDNKATMTIVPADSSKDDISKQATDIATNNTVKTDDPSYQDENGTTQNESIVDAVDQTPGASASVASDVTIVVQTYTDVQVADITVAGTTITEVKYDITPMAQKVATTTAIAEQAKINSEAIKTTGDDKNAVKVGKPEKINVNAATMVTIPLPDNFLKTDVTPARQYYTNEEVYIKHVKEDGSTYTYKGKIVNETAPQRVYAVTFLNPHGFSEFTVSPTTNTVASITRDATTVYFETLQDAVDYVADNETIEITKNIDSAYVATVNRSVTFVVSNTTYTFDPAVNIRAGYSVNMTYNSATGTFTATYVPSYPYYPVEDPSADFWNDVESAIKNAKPGQTVKVNAKDFDKMPWQVMETLRTSDNVTLLITWNGGKDITIPASKALKKDSSFIYYPLSYLAELDFGTAEANPETSDVVENTTPDTPQDTLPGEDKDQLNKPDASEGTQSAEPTRQAGNGLLIAGGLALLAVLALVITEIILRKRNKNA